MAYLWEVEDVATGEVVAEGTVRSAADGTITVPGVPIATGGVRLTVQPGDWSEERPVWVPLVVVG